MKKIDQNKKIKRDKILEAARKIFLSDGFAGTNMDKIAKEASVTKQTLYRYFKSKEELFKTTLEVQRFKLNNDFVDELDNEDTIEALQSFSIGFIKRHLSKEHLATIRLLVSEGPEVPELTRAFYAVGPGKTKPKLNNFLEERFGIDEVEFETDVFLTTLISKRMPVLTGLNDLPSDREIHDHAKKTVDLLIRILNIKKLSIDK